MVSQTCQAEISQIWVCQAYLKTAEDTMSLSEVRTVEISKFYWFVHRVTFQVIDCFIALQSLIWSRIGFRKGTTIIQFSRSFQWGGGRFVDVIFSGWFDTSVIFSHLILRKFIREFWNLMFKCRPKGGKREKKNVFLSWKSSKRITLFDTTEILDVFIS